MWAVDPAVITDVLDQHACAGFFEFWTATFWMIHGSGKTLPTGESAALRHPCIYIQRHCYGWWYFSISVGVTKEIAHWPIPNRRRSPFRLQPWWLFADREDALWCSAFKTPFQRILIAGCQVYHWCPQQFTVTLPLVTLWLLHYTAWVHTFLYLCDCHGYAMTKKSHKGHSSSTFH